MTWYSYKYYLVHCTLYQAGTLYLEGLVLGSVHALAPFAEGGGRLVGCEVRALGERGAAVHVGTVYSVRPSIKTYHWYCTRKTTFNSGWSSHTVNFYCKISLYSLYCTSEIITLCRLPG